MRACVRAKRTREVKRLRNRQRMVDLAKKRPLLTAAGNGTRVAVEKGTECRVRRRDEGQREAGGPRAAAALGVPARRGLRRARCSQRGRERRGRSGRAGPRVGSQ